MPSPVELDVRRWGSGDRSALLVHGLSSSSEGWWRLGPELADLGWAVTAPDLRAHGGSPDCGDLSLAAYRDDLLDLGVGWDVVLGHSLGGLVTLACQLAMPDFAATLILEDPWLRVTADAGVEAWLAEEYAGPITEAGIAAKRPGWAPEDVAGKVRALLAAGPHMVSRTVAALDGNDLWPDLARVSVPTLLVAADPDLDALVAPEDGRAATAANPGVRYVTIPGASHSIHRDSYDVFWAQVVSFLREAVPNRRD